jgi:hypothetical protein
MTTLGNAAPGSAGNMELTLMVLTSDDTFFSAGLTDPIVGDDETPLRGSYEATAAKLSDKPALMFSFAPLLTKASGDFYVNAFNSITGGVPNFGSITVDNNFDYHDARVIFNGEAYADRYAFVLVGGNIHPEFYLGSISSGRIFPERSVITASRGNQIHEINNMLAVDYLKSIGVSQKEGNLSSINVFPAIIDFNDGTEPVVRALFAATPEGYVVGGGDFPAGATITIGSLDNNEVIRSTTASLKAALARGNADCFIMFSCVGRYFAMEYNPRGEIEKVQEIMEKSGIPYQFTYSGGELCPVHIQGKGNADKDSPLTNRNHNDTFIICALR